MVVADPDEGFIPGHDDDCELELVMPFIPVQSRGGPHDDAAYVAGYEMGRIDAILATAQTLGLTPDTHYVIRTENGPQIDLIAMRYGFTAVVEEVGEGWSNAAIAAIVPTEEDSDG
jgi:hypothetical protein